ncbi:Protein TIFY 4B-like isoform X1 [Dionaea muscipula]
MSAGLATTLAETTTTTTTSARSVLDKPLHELTEDDISQLTREDCRRYLQEKGMRRPSWNKSQAIQQVISLKSLLEPPPPSLPPNHPAPPPENPPPATSNSCSSFKELSQTDAEGSVSATEPLRESGCPQPAVDNKAVSPRSLDTTVLPPGQMTIFYSGKVNIYEGVPADRAQTILHVAASPFQFSHNEQSRPSSQWATSLSSHPSNVKFSVVHPHPRMSPPILTACLGFVAICTKSGRKRGGDGKLHLRAGN